MTEQLTLVLHGTVFHGGGADARKVELPVRMFGTIDVDTDQLSEDPKLYANMVEARAHELLRSVVENSQAVTGFVRGYEDDGEFHPGLAIAIAEALLQGADHG